MINGYIYTKNQNIMKQSVVTILIFDKSVVTSS
jgi:hypothetical protein